MRSRWLGVRRVQTPGSGLAEWQLLIGDRCEREAVQRRDAVGGDRRAVLGRRVTDVGVEVPIGMALRGPPHVAVSRDLRQHRGGRDRRASRVAADHRALLELEPGYAKAVDEAERVPA